MKKDKEWLKEEVYRLYPSHTEMYEHPDYLTVEKCDLVNKFIDLIDQLEEPEKVVIPQFVAEWIEECQKRGLGLGQALDYGNLDIMPHEMKEYIKFNFSKLGCGRDKQELVARAWLDGYKVEKEKLYYIINDAQQLMLVNAGYAVPTLADFEVVEQAGILKKYQLTEEEIKKYDERYWSFALEVSE